MNQFFAQGAKLNRELSIPRRHLKTTCGSYSLPHYDDNDPWAVWLVEPGIKPAHEVQDLLPEVRPSSSMIILLPLNERTPKSPSVPQDFIFYIDYPEPPQHPR